ncbi:Rne/Rng family ribonuclease [Desulfovibrio sp. 6_1_46AFAA]|uniref:Rne/Rng family ribonuclease n=1 Tax=Desulfovibrio sp. 6_1_46AFAA TaxID=665942 RepID=UPI001E4314D4|nr:Rne/Rng family ribonuclease [Desulfovibrio sp. 6_1_46AFAA]
MPTADGKTTENADAAAAPKARGGRRTTAKSPAQAPEGGEDSPAKAKRAPAQRTGKGRRSATAKTGSAETGAEAMQAAAPAQAAATGESPAETPEKAAKAAPKRGRNNTTRGSRAKKAPASLTSPTSTVAAAPAETDTPSPQAESRQTAPTAGATTAKAPKEISRPESLPPKGVEQVEASVDAEEAAPGNEDDGNADAPRRKSRRGRRGGRGRNRKNRQTATGEMSEDDAAADDNMDDAAVERTGDADDEAFDEVDTAAEVPVAEGGVSAPKGRGKKGKSVQNAEAEDNKKTTARATAAKAKTGAATGKKRMFISVLPGEQVEVALAEEGCLLEYYLDMLHQRKIKGNIYKGVIHNIDTNLQAAFVSYGAGKNGFLQIDEIHPEYWLAHHEPAKGKKFPPIQKVLKAGQEVLVQVVKEPTGNKGAFLTTWLSLAGRFLVLTPGQEQIGVSRKVENDEERARLREMMNGIDPGQGLGVIVRTVSAGTTKTTLKNDLQYLKRLWRDIRKKATEISAPALIHQEPGLSERAVRDYLTDDVCEIWVDNEEVAQGIRDTVSLLFPRKKDLVRLHGDIRQSMWERFNLRRQLDQIYSREVLLPSGGRLVFDQTEALMAVDINSGKISGKGNFEAMAFKTNMEAAETIARQLKLRDVGGQVVIDFIEMRDKKHILDVEKTLRQAMKNDRARHDVARMSSFGLLELVRQRMGSSALAITMEPCPACGGTGQRRNLEWQALQGLRELRRMLRATNGEKCTFEATRELGLYLLNHKRDSLREMEQDFGKCLEIAIRT